VGLVDRLLAGVETRTTTGTLAEPPDWLWDALGGSKTWAGNSVTMRSALGLIPVWAAVNLVASSVGSLPLIVYRGEGRDKERARETPQWQLCHDKPNRSTVADQFWENTTGHLLTQGNFFAEKSRFRAGPRAGLVGELWALDPTKVKVERTDAGDKRFTVNDEQRTFATSEILHIPAFGYDGVIGYSPLTIARQPLGTMQARDEHEARTYSQGGLVPGAIRLENRLENPEQVARLRSAWAEATGLANAGRPVVLEEGASWQNIGLSPKDLQFVETANLTVSQVARLFQVPPEMIGGAREGGSVTYANVETQGLNFVQFSLRRWLIRIENALAADSDLFPDKDVYPEFLVEGLLRADSSGRAAYYEKALDPEHGWMLRNEARERENLPPVEGWDDPAQPAAAPAPAAPPDPAVARSTENGHISRDDFLAGLERIAAAQPDVYVPPTEFRIEEGAIQVNVEAQPPANVEVHPAELRLEKGAIEVNVERDGARTVTFPDGRMATITPADDRHEP
jgi:HK97 family phage portal protein